MGRRRKGARRAGGPTLRGLWRYSRRVLGLAEYLDAPGDGRFSPQIPASQLIWSILAMKVLRVSAFRRVERFVRNAGRAFGRIRPISDDALAYFTDRLDPEPTRRAAAAVVRRAKRNKAFERCVWIGFALDGTSFAHGRTARCAYCHPSYDKDGNVTSCCHKGVMISVVGTGTALVLPFDAELYRLEEGELKAAKTLLTRARPAVGRRFAQFLVVDSLYAGAPYAHLAGDLGLPVVIRLKGNLPELSEAARKRFATAPPSQVFQDGNVRVELWDADDFLAWQGLRWPSVRVLRYRETHPNGTITDASWFTDLSVRRVGSKALYRMCKSRWGIENQGFNDAKNRYGLAHLPHHTPQTLLLHFLLTGLALSIERLFRLRYLHRGARKPLTAIQLCDRLLCNLARTPAYDTS